MKKNFTKRSYIERQQKYQSLKSLIGLLIIFLGLLPSYITKLVMTLFGEDIFVSYQDTGVINVDITNKIGIAFFVYVLAYFMSAMVKSLKNYFGENNKNDTLVIGLLGQIYSYFLIDFYKYCYEVTYHKLSTILVVIGMFFLYFLIIYIYWNCREKYSRGKNNIGLLYLDSVVQITLSKIVFQNGLKGIALLNKDYWTKTKVLQYIGIYLFLFFVTYISYYLGESKKQSKNWVIKFIYEILKIWVDNLSTAYIFSITFFDISWYYQRGIKFFAMIMVVYFVLALISALFKIVSEAIVEIWNYIDTKISEKKRKKDARLNSIYGKSRKRVRKVRNNRIIVKKSRRTNRKF